MLRLDHFVRSELARLKRVLLFELLDVVEDEVAHLELVLRRGGVLECDPPGALLLCLEEERLHELELLAQDLEVLGLVEVLRCVVDLFAEDVEN